MHAKNSLITNSLRALMPFNDYIQRHSRSQTAVSLNEISLIALSASSDRKVRTFHEG